MNCFDGFFVDKLDCKQFQEFLILLLKRCCHSKDIGSTIKLKKATYSRFASGNCDPIYLEIFINKFNAIDETKYYSHGHLKNVNSIADYNKIILKAPKSWRDLKKRRKLIEPIFRQSIQMFYEKCSDFNLNKARSHWIFNSVYKDCFFGKPRKTVDENIWQKLKDELSAKDFEIVNKYYKINGNKYVLTISKMNIYEILRLVKLIYPYYHEN